MEHHPYLDYLDKEMTIMGILSAFSVAAPAGILAASISKDSQVAVQFWNTADIFVITGSIYCVVAALLFYKQRSTLAWYYGQIALVEATESTETVAAGIIKWLRRVDSWATWWSYCCAFTALLGGFASYFFGVVIFLARRHACVSYIRIGVMEQVFLWSAPAVMLCTAATQSYVRHKYRYEDLVWMALWKDLRKLL